MNSRALTGWSFLILGLLTAVFGAVMLTIRLVALQKWTHLQGEVTDAVVQGPDLDDNFTAKVTVRWKFAGADYSKQFDNWGQSTGRESFDRILARYPKGSAAPILCDPAKPSSAFLDAGYSFSFLAVPSTVILLSLLIFGLGLWLARRY
jgi:hypothetical protein